MMQKMLKETIILGIFFLLMTTTYSSFSNVVSFISTHSDKEYGFEGQVVLIVNYLVYLIGLVKATTITNFKKQFLIAAICYSVNYALYFLQFNKDSSLVIGIVGAIIGGYGASILWVSEGGYMTLLLKKYNTQQNKEGHYLGILNSLICGQSLFGAIFITFGLGIFGNEIYFIILTGTGLLAFVFCYFLLDPLEEVNQQKKQLIQEGQQLNKEKTNGQKSTYNQLKEILRFYPKMKHLIFPMVLDGVIMGFISTGFNNFLPQAMRDSLHLGYLLIITGVGAIIGAFLAGYLTDKIKTSKVGTLIFLFTLLTMFLTYFVFIINFQTIIYGLMLGFMWGVSFNALESWLFVCCTKIYNGKIESYAIVKQVHTLSYVLFQVHMIITDNHIHYNVCLIMLITLSIFSVISCKALENVFAPAHRKDMESIQSSSPEGGIN